MISHQSHILSHVGGVHENMNNYVTAKSDNTSSDERNFKKHIGDVDKKVKNYACEQCHYVSAKKSKLNSHIKAVHDCEECGKSFSRGCLKRHIDEVHDKMKKLIAPLDKSVTAAVEGCSHDFPAPRDARRSALTETQTTDLGSGPL